MVDLDDFIHRFQGVNEGLKVFIELDLCLLLGSVLEIVKLQALIVVDTDNLIGRHLQQVRHALVRCLNPNVESELVSI